jgi:hypothetical protein
MDVAGLPDMMTTHLSLDVVLRVPVTVVNDDCRRSCEVEPNAARLCPEQEDECVRLWVVESVDKSLPICAVDAIVQALVCVAAMATEVLAYVEHADHL